ncbi:hypothetical protein JMJ35_003372 [Cladonia borealis]|uniref:Uncharacterized protein n=1 Tax=Cladonia borealis TaxID=184061 RepID=A0AA39V989_9LECA|nr:hypothetical protein JMJ35_003372 [Cladonia borealis]
MDRDSNEISVAARFLGILIQLGGQLSEGERATLREQETQAWEELLEETGYQGIVFDPETDTDLRNYVGSGPGNDEGVGPVVVNTPQQRAQSPVAPVVNPLKRPAQSPARRYELRRQRKSTYTDIYEHIDHDEEEEAAVSVGIHEEEENGSIFTPDDESLESEEPPSSGEAEDGGSDDESPEDWDMDCGTMEEENSDVTGNSGGEYGPM